MSSSIWGHLEQILIFLAILINFLHSISSQQLTLKHKSTKTANFSKNLTIKKHL